MQNRKKGPFFRFIYAYKLPFTHRYGPLLYIAMHIMHKRKTHKKSNGDSVQAMKYDFGFTPTTSNECYSARAYWRLILRSLDRQISDTDAFTDDFGDLFYKMEQAKKEIARLDYLRLKNDWLHRTYTETTEGPPANQC